MGTLAPPEKPISISDVEEAYNAGAIVHEAT
jgi:hypothetical protein